MEKITLWKKICFIKYSRLNNFIKIPYLLLSEWYYCLISSDRLLWSLFPQREDHRIQWTSFIFRCDQEWNRWRNEEGEDRTPSVLCRIEEGNRPCCMIFIAVIDKLLLHNELTIRIDNNDSWLGYYSCKLEILKQRQAVIQTVQCPIMRFRQVYRGVAVLIMDYPQQETTKKDCLQSTQVENNNQTNLTSLILTNPPRMRNGPALIFRFIRMGVIH